MRYCRNKSSTLYCFNPLITFFTGTVEILLAVFSCAKYSKTVFGRIVTLILVILAVFQFSEYTICSGDAVALWNKIGYAVIALLPALGMHLTELITRKTFLTPLCYIVAAILAISILIIPGTFVATYCTGSFVLFELNSFLRYSFGTYYFLCILAAMIKLALSLLRKKKYAKLIAWLFTGYLSFLIPTLTVTLLFASSQTGIPSVMCGFAILLALIMTFKVLPLYHENINTKKIIHIG